MNILKREDPQTIANILNGKQSILVMKQAPKNSEGRWWYLYCSKDSKKTLSYQAIELSTKKDRWGRRIVTAYTGFNDKEFKFQFLVIEKIDIKNGWGWFAKEHNLNGKVVARFWCDKVEELFWDTNTIDENVKGIHWIADEDFEKTCLTYEEYENYLEEGKNGYAIHISKLEVFDRPRELGEFMKPHTAYDITKVSCKKKDAGKCNWGKSLKTGKWIGCNKFRLTKAPINYCYIEGD